jgi:phosphate-selective porin OprO/OprP
MRLLCLVLTLAFSVLSLAEDVVTEGLDPELTKICDRGLSPEDNAKTSVQAGVNTPDEDCVQPAPEVIEVARQEITAEITENTQSAYTLKTLLLGQNYIFFGRGGLEYAAYSGDVPSSENGWDLRRLRFGIAGFTPFFDRVSYKLELDLTDGTNSLSDLYLQWDSLKRGSIRVGNQRVSQNLSAMTSSLSQLFMERPLPVTAFSLRRRLAVSHDVERGRWGTHGMLFGRDPNNDAGKYGWAFRLFAKPIFGPKHVGHLGFSLVSEKMDREARYLTRPESNVTDFRLVDTGLYNDVQYQHTAGLELAGEVDSYSLRLEVFRSRWERDAGRRNTFNGAYLEAGHFLTGQNFSYKKGKFVRPQLEPGAHAWEIGLRASWVDLNDRDIHGGEQMNFGAALNYYRRPNLRFMLNLLRFRTDSVAGDDRGWILQGRVQFNH